jgi:hypothetical protein
MCVDNPEQKIKKPPNFRRLDHNSRYASALPLSTNAHSKNADGQARCKRYNPPVETGPDKPRNVTYPVANRLWPGRHFSLSIPPTSHLQLVDGIQHVVTSVRRATRSGSAVRSPLVVYRSRPRPGPSLVSVARVFCGAFCSRFPSFCVCSRSGSSSLAAASSSTACALGSFATVILRAPGGVSPLMRLEREHTTDVLD